MRREFSNIVEQILTADSRTVFITGDLGYNALENIKISAKSRFINAGVAEQNMVGVAAGLAYKGFQTFTYSIAPFAVYRCLEQIRLDVCIHNLPVYIVGNGGGYGYGIMGATHHAIEDIACLSALPNMTCWVPAFTEDVAFCLGQITKNKKPAYLRLGLGKFYPTAIKISKINFVVRAETPKVTIITLGPVVTNVLEAIKGESETDVFTVLAIPLLRLSDELVRSIMATRKVMVVEEHAERGGLAEHLLLLLTKIALNDVTFKSLNAKGYRDKLYGSQAFHQAQSGLDESSIRLQISQLILNDKCAD